MIDDRAGSTVCRAAARLVHGGLTVLPLFWVVGVCAVELALPETAQFAQLLAVAPAVACASTARRACVLRAAVCAVAALGLLTAAGTVTPGAPAGILVSIVAVFAVSCFSSRRSKRLQGELDRTREVAEAVQQALLRPLPARVGTVGVAGEYLSAGLDARVGGDLYEVLGTPHGLRAVLGDVRGHGLPAVKAVSALLGSFREAAHEEPDLGGLLRRMDRAFRRHLEASGPDDEAAEEFATLLLLELHEDGTVRTVNCGHPRPLRIGPAAHGPVRVEELVPSQASPPLGIADLDTGPVPVDKAFLPPGETLLLFTDGAEDARDSRGSFFPLTAAAASAARVRPEPLDPAAFLARLRNSLLRHAGGRLPDDVAMLALRPAAVVPAPAAGDRAAPAAAPLPAEP